MTQIALVSAFMSYVLGSFPTAFLFGKKYLKQDIQDVGTQNSGAYNVFKSIGWIQGIATLLIDALKGYLPVTIAYHQMNLSPFWVGACASMALIGHNWPIFTCFRGGKGGSTSAGILFALFPAEFPLMFLAFIILVAISRNLSLGLGICVLTFPLVAWLTDKPAWMIITASLIALIGLIRIIPFIRRMILMSQGSTKKMFIIIMKGFKKYEQFYHSNQ